VGPPWAADLSPQARAGSGDKSRRCGCGEVVDGVKGEGKKGRGREGKFVGEKCVKG
jgi:hypothetical protein